MKSDKKQSGKKEQKKQSEQEKQKAKSTTYSKRENYRHPFSVVLRKFTEDGNKEHSQAALAKYLDISSQAVSFYVNGQNFPGFEILNKIADFYSVSVDYLMGRTKIPSPEPDMQAACAYTGLSESAVSTLHQYVSLLQTDISTDKAQSVDECLDLLNKEKIFESILIFIDELLKSKDIGKIARNACADLRYEVYGARYENILLLDQVYNAIWNRRVESRMWGEPLHLFSEERYGERINNINHDEKEDPE